MKAMGLWNHPDFFGYCDRWMTQMHSDSAEIVAIKAARGWDFSPDWERQGASWDVVTNDMWKTYRNASAINSPALFRAGNNQRLIVEGKMQSLAGLKIGFSASHASLVSITVYDLSGRVIRRLVDAMVEAGDHSIFWDGKAKNGAIIGHGCFELAAVIDGCILVKRLIVLK
jgi:hypothetical protein